jgi:hypothetical protein
MQYYRFEPGQCYTEQGITWRPFLIDGKEIFKMRMSVMLDPNDRKSADQEVLKLCDKIKEITGAIVSPGELPQLISERKIVKNG